MSDNGKHPLGVNKPEIPQEVRDNAVIALSRSRSNIRSMVIEAKAVTANNPDDEVMAFMLMCVAIADGLGLKYQNPPIQYLMERLVAALMEMATEAGHG